MNKINIPLSGIIRNTDDAISKDGQCMELINARSINGSIEPVGKPILEKAFPSGRTPIYIHKNGIYEHVISYDSSNNVIHDCNRASGTYTNKNISICNLPNLKEVQSIGNTLILITNNGMYFALFVDGAYKYLGSKPDFPEVCIESYREYPIERTPEYWCDLDPRIKMRDKEWVVMNDNSIKLVNSSIRGNAAKFINELNNDKKFIYPVVTRYAMRLFDGSYIMHSAPKLLRCDNAKLRATVTNTSVKDGYITDFKYQISVSASTFSIKYNLSSLAKWKDIVSSVDIFISRPIVTDKIDEDITSFYCDGTHIRFDLNELSDNEIIEKIKDTSNFYLIKSIPVGSNSSGYFEGLISDASQIENLEQKETLPDDAFTHNEIFGTTYVFNSRLHVANTKMIFAPMYPIGTLQESTGARIVQIKTEVQIKTDTGIKVIHGSSYCGGGDISPYISYPDSRAFKITIYFTGGGSHYRSFILKPHPWLNTAYNLDTLTPYSMFGGGFISGIYTPVSEDKIELSPNKIKVSSVGNPFFFPAKQTYVVSNRGIIGMSAATVALSSGQFGQFPLYVFSEDGIYALSAGSGEIAYTNSSPVSRDCCNNPHSIVSTDNAVVFSTSRGLMILLGSNVEKISGSIEGYLPSSIDSSPIIKKIAGIAGFQKALSSTEFVFYLENARVGYNYEDKAIIVSNPSLSYSYVFDLESREWYKISVSIRSFINSYPECFAIFTDNGMYNLHNPHRTVNNILLLTRPVKLGSLTHKRILQSALRGVVKPSLSNLYFRGEPVQFRGQGINIFSETGFYVLGSNDAEHFTLLSGTEKIKDIRDLITKMNKTKAYKYFMFCLVGGVRTDVAINYIELMADEVFENRLR